MDLSKLSDADLQAIAAGDMSRVSTDGLKHITGAAPEATRQPETAAPSVTPSQPERGVLDQFGRAAGLFARTGVEGLADTAQIVTEPLRYFQDKLTPGPAKTVPLGVATSRVLDSLGLPKPETRVERVVGDTNRLLAGTGGLMGGAKALATRVADPLAKGVLTVLASHPGTQALAAAGSGVAGSSAKEAGAGPLTQVGAALAGGVGAGLLPGLAERIATLGRASVNAVRNEFAPQAQAKNADALLDAALRRAGRDYASVPERVRQVMRADINAALNTGQQLDPAAMSRLLDFRRVGGIPTIGGITQNPVAITREMNLAKTAVNTGDDSLHGLARVQNENNKTLIRNLNDAGTLPRDMYDPGKRVTSSIKAIDESKAARVKELYDTAKGLAGGDIPLERKPFVDAVYGSLVKENKLNFLPDSISNMLDTISKGQIVREGQTHVVPFTADTLDTLMTVLATEQRATSNGNVKRALSLAREALDSVPLAPVKPVTGSAVPVTGEVASVLRAGDAAPAKYMEALNAARAAARDRFKWQESAKPIEAALAGAEPDNYLKAHLFSPGSTLRDAEAIAKHSDTKAVRDAILLHLKDKATGGAADDVGKFSQANYNRALRDLGDRKLGLFFDSDELDHLKTLGRAASYMQVQPSGSAVNNSNSGALLLGKMYDGLRAGLSHIYGIGPVVSGVMEAAIGNPAKHAANWSGARDAQNISRAVITPQRASGAAQLILPGAALAASAE